MSSRKKKASPPDRPTPNVSQPAPVTEAAEWGELLRRLALGIITALVASRVFWTSDAANRGYGTDSDLVAMVHQNGTLWVLLVLIAAIAGIASMIIGGKTRLRFSLADAALLTLVVLIALSSTYAVDRRPALNLAWEWIGWGMAYALIRCLPRTRSESWAIAIVITAAAVGTATYGVFQVGIEQPQLREYYLSHPREAMMAAGISPDSEMSRKNFEDRLLGSREVYSTFALANSFAGFLAGPAALALAIGVAVWRQKNNRVGALSAAALPLGLIFLCLLLTKSRSAYVALMVVAGILAWGSWLKPGALSPDKKKRLLLFAGLALGLIVVIVGVSAQTGIMDWQVLTESTKSLRYRWEYWIGSWGAITETSSSFWMGYGPGNFASPYLRHKLAESSEMIIDPHNLLLEVWATGGFPAAIALIVTLGAGLWSIFGKPQPQYASKHQDSMDPLNEWGWLLLCGAAGWLITPLFEPNPAFLTRWVWLFVGFAGTCGLALGFFRSHINAQACGLAALAVAINLLAAGGISYASVALPMWIWLALGLNLRDDRACGQLRTFSIAPACGAALVWSAFVGLFYAAIIPFWKAEARLADAVTILNDRSVAPDYAKVEELCIRAIEQDSYCARPFLVLAGAEYQAWYSNIKASSDKKDWVKPLISLEKAMEEPRSPETLAIHLQRFEMARNILGRLSDKLTPNDQTYLQGIIINSARKATQIHPTDATLHAKLALASAELPTSITLKAAIEEARQALALDEMTPHADKKLPDDVRKFLKERLAEWQASVK